MVSRVKDLLPPHRSPSARVLEWVVERRASLLLGLFSLLALSLLTWQTLSGLSLNQRMTEQLLAAHEQAETLRRQGQSMNEQAATAASQVAKIADLAEAQRKAAAAASVQATNLQHIGAVASGQVAALRRVSREVTFGSMQAIPLRSLYVKWTLGAPPWRKVPEVVARATCDHVAASDDGTKNWPPSIFWRVCNSVRVDDVLLPAVRAVATGADSLTAMYGGDLQNLLTATPDPTDGLAWHAVAYQGKPFELLMPLSSDASIVLSLGDKSDVPLRAATSGEPEENTTDSVARYIHAHTQHDFQVEVQARSGLALEWNYASLHGSLDGEGPTAYFPVDFKFAIFHGSLPRAQYVQHLRAANEVATPSDSTIVRPWSERSELQLVANGAREFVYDYDVRNLGRGSVAVVPDSEATPIDENSDNPDDWEHPKKRYYFTLFHAKRR